MNRILFITALACLWASALSNGIAQVKHSANAHIPDSQRLKAKEVLVSQEQGVKIWLNPVDKSVDIVNDSGRSAKISYIFEAVSGSCTLESAQSCYVKSGGHYTGAYPAKIERVDFSNW